MPWRSGGGAGRVFSFSRLWPKVALKLKVVPRPGLLATRISPPIISTSRLLMVRPSPVPPYLRVVEVSAWLKD